MRDRLSWAIGVALTAVLLPAATVAADPAKIRHCTTISESGAYVLASNLTASGDCLIVAADFVSINLAGFVISGDGTGVGISDNFVSRRGTAIRNGTIANFANAVRMELSSFLQVHDVRVLQVGSGIAVAASSVIKDNVVIASGVGVLTGPGAVITNNTVSVGTRDAIKVICPSLVLGNQAFSASGDAVETNLGPGGPCVVEQNAVTP